MPNGRDGKSRVDGAFDRRAFIEGLVASMLVACGVSSSSGPNAGGPGDAGGASNGDDAGGPPQGDASANADAALSPAADGGFDAANSDADVPITPTAPILVIGAGISGLSAAAQLVARGFTNVRVIEARQRLGGRLFTDRSTGTPFDMGGAWVEYASDPTNPLLGLLTNLGVTPAKTDWDSYQAYDEQTGLVSNSTLDAAETSFESAQTTASNTVNGLSNQNVSIGSILTPLLNSSFTTPAQLRLLNALIPYYITNEYGAELAEIGAYDFGSNAPGGGGNTEDDRLVGGFDVLINSLAKGLTVQLGEPVTSISYDENSVTVVTSLATYQVAAVIVTLPVGVLRAGTVVFNPPLPAAKQQALIDIGFGYFEKAILLYDAAFWPTTPNAFGYASASTEPSPLWVNVQAVSGVPALIAMFAADEAVPIASMSDSDLETLVTGQVAAMFGASSPAPKAFLRTSWATDPYSLGAYTYPALPDVETAIAALGASVGGRLFFAGEATDPTWYSYAHGAYLSGIRAANEV